MPKIYPIFKFMIISDAKKKLSDTMTDAAKIYFPNVPSVYKFPY